MPTLTDASALAVLDAPTTDLPSPSDVVAAGMRWHFSEATGSAFWLERKKRLPFDPINDIRTVENLTEFDDVSTDLRTTALADLIPKGSRDCVKRAPLVFESSGTTGPPKRVPDLGSAWRNIKWYQSFLDGHGVPRARGDILWLGPTGPHLAAYAAHVLAELRGGSCFTVDADPRWVKSCMREGRSDEADRYVGHLLDQAGWILSSQRISILFTTPPLLKAMLTRPYLTDAVRTGVDAVLWGGASMDRHTRLVLKREVFADIPVVGIYGNTLLGAAPERPVATSDDADCIFQTFIPYSYVSIVDENTGNEVPYNQRGRFRVHRIDRDVFLPNVLERDSGVRVPPVAGYVGDGVANVRPLPTVGNARVIEGMY